MDHAHQGESPVSASTSEDVAQCLRVGVRALASDELVSLLLGGSRTTSRRLMRRHGSLRAIGGRTVGELAREPGLNYRRAARLLAAFEITVGSHVTEIAGVVADIPELPWPELWALAEASDVRCPDGHAAERIRAAIESP